MGATLRWNVLYGCERWEKLDWSCIGGGNGSFSLRSLCMIYDEVQIVQCSLDVHFSQILALLRLHTDLTRHFHPTTTVSLKPTPKFPFTLKCLGIFPSPFKIAIRPHRNLATHNSDARPKKRKSAIPSHLFTPDVPKPGTMPNNVRGASIRVAALAIRRQPITIRDTGCNVASM